MQTHSFSSNQFNSGSSLRPRVMALEIETLGHHPSYVRNFAKTWLDCEIDADIDFLVTPKFFKLHAEEVDYVQSLSPHGIRIHSLTEDEESRMESVSYLRYFGAWKLYCQYATSLNASHGLIMFSDFFQLPMLFGKRSPCPFSIIYFRPTYHYKKLANYSPSWSETFRATRKKWLMGRVLQVPNLERVFSLDILAVEFLRQHFQPKPAIEFLPDAFALFPSTLEAVTALRTRLGVDESRMIFSLVGILDRRKGVRELLEASLALQEKHAKRVCILLIGKLLPANQQEVLAMLQAIEERSHVQVILRNEFVPESELQQYYELSDVVLATYQKHMGGSSALIRASMACRPVLSSDYGLMGELVRRKRLGLTVDTTQPASIAQGIVAFLEGHDGCQMDVKSAAEFVDENSSTRLGETLRKMVVNSVLLKR
jgi:glycosyltransferase involved in cell wall biosynthesis